VASSRATKGWQPNSIMNSTTPHDLKRGGRPVGRMR
jgi:hypothetical protein